MIILIMIKKIIVKKMFYKVKINLVVVGDFLIEGVGDEFEGGYVG